ncbi:acyl-CoA dehydrogenase family protein [soil metagenome]
MSLTLPDSVLDSPALQRDTADRRTLLARLPALAAAIGVDAAARESQRVLPFDGIERFRESGLAMLRIPAHLDGPGGSIEDLIHVVSTLAAADSNLAHALRLHFNITEGIALTAPNAFIVRQANRVLDGAIFGGASTELGTAKPGQFNTVLRREGDRYRLSGRKYYATGTAFADYANISVLDEDGQNIVVTIPVDRAGVEVLDDWDGMGQRMTASGSLVLTNVEVFPDEFVIRNYETLVGRHSSAMRQLHLVAVAAGIVRNVLSDMTAYVQTRGRPANHSAADSARTDPFNQQIIGDLAASSHAIDGLIIQNARSLDRSASSIERNAPDAEDRVLESTLATAKTQLIVGKLALEACERMFEAGGASATSRSLNFDRHWRNVRTLFSHNPLLHKSRVIGDWQLNGEATHLREGKFF